MTGLHREIRFEPGYDHRHDDEPESRSIGSHGLTMRWLLTGDAGAVQFVIYTGWLPSWVDTEHPAGPMVTMEKFRRTGRAFPPAPATLGHHWCSRVANSDAEPSGHCAFLEGRPCAYGGAGVDADRLLAGLITDGHEYVWSILESYFEMCDEHARRLVGAAS